jgi:hypothetical protein
LVLGIPFDLSGTRLADVIFLPHTTPNDNTRPVDDLVPSCSAPDPKTLSSVEQRIYKVQSSSCGFELIYETPLSSVYFKIDLGGLNREGEKPSLRRIIIV